MSYVKFHRSIINHERLWNDTNAYIMFTRLLLCVDWKTGSIKTGRKKLAHLCNMKESTAWVTALRLQSDSMLTVKSTAAHSIITICNWKKYQEDVDRLDDNKATTKQQQSNTINKKQETIKKEDSVIEPEFKTNFKTPKAHSRSNPYRTEPEASPEAKDICMLFGRVKGGYYQTPVHLKSIDGLIKQHGYDYVVKVVEFAINLKSKVFQVTIASPAQLADKWASVVELMEMPAAERDKKVFF